jgi:sodium-dependent phosphate transporter
VWRVDATIYLPANFASRRFPASLICKLYVILPCRNAALSGLSHDIHADIDGDAGLQDMHADAEKFDPRTEQVFKVLQVISACAMSFAHGEGAVHLWL